jgi:hypothetical protein
MVVCLFFLAGEDDNDDITPDKLRAMVTAQVDSL